jgi:hypothetical protein
MRDRSCCTNILDIPDAFKFLISMFCLDVKFVPKKLPATGLRQDQKIVVDLSTRNNQETQRFGGEVL